MLTGGRRGFNPPLLLKFMRATHPKPTARPGFVVQLLQTPEPALDSQFCGGKSERPAPSFQPQLTSSHPAMSPSWSLCPLESPLQTNCAQALSGQGWLAVSPHRARACVGN